MTDPAPSSQAAPVDPTDSPSSPPTDSTPSSQDPAPVDPTDSTPSSPPVVDDSPSSSPVDTGAAAGSSDAAPAAPALSLLDVVEYHVNWPTPSVQVGLVVEVNEYGNVALAWLGELSGFISPDELTRH